MSSNDSEEKNKIKVASFNQDYKYFVIGTKNGFKVYNTEPFELGVERELDGDYSIIQLLYKTNIMGLVGTYHQEDESEEDKKKKNTKYLAIWDNYEKKKLLEMSFKENIISLKMRKDNFYVVCRTKIHVFNMKNFNPIDTIETYDNPLGLLGINYSMDEVPIIAFPDRESGKGFIRVKKSDSDNTTFQVKAHESELANIVISYDGKIMATASGNGQKIRIFDLTNGEKLQELHRGEEKVAITTINISSGDDYLAASSNKGTIHIWSLSESVDKLIAKGLLTENSGLKKGKAENAKGFFGFLGFGKTQWSFSQVRLKEPYSVFAFGTDNSLIILSYSGTYLKVNVDYENGGECKALCEEKIDFESKS